MKLTPSRTRPVLPQLGVFLGLVGLFAPATLLPHRVLAAGPPEGFSDFSELRLEDLLAQEVVSVSRFSQELRESPMSVHVLTREDIRRSGATTIPEVLRLVPGVHVAATSGSSYDVGMRGSSRIPTNNLLVMIDGRSVYTDCYGLTLWELLPIDLYEVESIEVIHGPGSALYGANAFTGVVNVITQDPREEQGTLTRGVNGSDDEQSTALMISRSVEDFAFRVSAANGTTTRRQTGSGHASDVARFHATAHYELSESSGLDLSAGHANGLVESSLLHMPETFDVDGQQEHVRADYRRGEFRLRGYWSRASLDVRGNGPLGALVAFRDVEDMVVDVEAQQRFDLWGPHPLIFGGSYRGKAVRWDGQNETRKQDLWAAFLHHERHFSERWLLSLGSRWDHHPLVGHQVSPRAAMVFLPAESHTLRVSWSQAHRNPSHFENFLSTNVTFVQQPVYVHGDEDLEPERIRSLEIGYRGLVHPRAMFGVTLYHNRFRDLIELVHRSEVPTLPPPDPGAPEELLTHNHRGVNATGAELELRLELASRTWLDASYSHTEAEDAETGLVASGVPRVLATLALRTELPRGLRVDARARYRGETTWRTNALGVLPATSTTDDGVLLADLRLGYPLPGRSSEFFVYVENLFDREHREAQYAAEFGRRFVASIVMGF